MIIKKKIEYIPKMVMSFNLCHPKKIDSHVL
jgi:hypothetical protein